MQPTKSEIQREVEVLKDLRRRSTTPGALTIDPDLPNQPSSTSPTKSYTVADGLTNEILQATPALDSPVKPDDPFHLFWVPASLHPEIAPDQFREFLKEHARNPPADGMTGLGRSLSAASTSSALGRKKSMLSRQYTPTENDGIENERVVVPLRRNRTSVYANSGPEITINDLQRLEELAEEASVSDDPSKLRNVLRRSLSLNVSPSALDQMDDMPDMGDEADAPIIVPPPGQILRRAARTKIRKPGLPGDGGGHRFGASRRGQRSSTTSGSVESSTTVDRSSSDMSSSDHGDQPDAPAPSRKRRVTNEHVPPPSKSRPDSYSDVFDAYGFSDEPDEMDEMTAATPVAATPIAEPVEYGFDRTPAAAPTEAPPLPAALLEAALGTTPELQLSHPQPTLLAPEDPHRRSTSQTPSPNSSTDNLDPQPIPSPTHTPPPPQQPPVPQQASTSQLPTQMPKKEKDKKGLFGKWGSDKSSKKGGKEKDRDEKETKDGGFFGSIFGSKKNKDEQGAGLGGSTTGREAAQALLGASKSSKAHMQALSPVPTGGNPWARYPLHVERAIYRLSHIKLANPRRPLYEQVLISNLMFWYLGVINKATTPQNQPPQPGQPVAAGGAPNGTPDTNGAGAASTSPQQEEKMAQEQQMQQQQGQQDMGRQRGEMEKEREAEVKSPPPGKKENGRKGPLTRPAPAGSGGSRRAEMPVRGPQYEMQHRVMEQEYGGYNSRSSSASSNTDGGGYTNAQQQQQPWPQQQQQQQHYQQSAPDQYYYSSGNDRNSGSGSAPSAQSPTGRGLPPGAMPPVSSSDQWSSGSSQQQQQQHHSHRHHSSPSPPPTQGGNSRPGPPDRRISRSPPSGLGSSHTKQYSPQDLQSQGGGGGRTPSRSLSATVSSGVSQQKMQSGHQQSSSQQGALANGKLRKGTSAHAVPYRPAKAKVSSSGGGAVNGAGEDEDVPLAVWQQQQQSRR